MVHTKDRFYSGNRQLRKFFGAKDNFALEKRSNLIILGCLHRDEIRTQ